MDIFWSRVALPQEKLTVDLVVRALGSRILLYKKVLDFSSPIWNNRQTGRIALPRRRRSSMVCTPETAPIYADEEICESTKRDFESLVLYTDACLL